MQGRGASSKGATAERALCGGAPCWLRLFSAVWRLAARQRADCSLSCVPPARRNTPPGILRVTDSAPPFPPGAVAIVGRPNVGKSSLLNSLAGKVRSVSWLRQPVAVAVSLQRVLLGCSRAAAAFHLRASSVGVCAASPFSMQERSIVSSMSGTTRDAIDTGGRCHACAGTLSASSSSRPTRHR